jgi:hypothetical protein
MVEPGDAPDRHGEDQVIIVALPDTAAAASAVAAVRDAYRAEFHQQSVGMTVHPTCGAF